MNLVLVIVFVFVIIIVTVAAAAANLTTTNSSTNTSSTTLTALTFTTSAYTHHDYKTKHGRLTMVERDTFFQIHSSEQSDLCIEVFKRLNQVGRLWLRRCKSKDEHGIQRQMFSVTNDGKLHPSTMPSSCIFLYNNKNLRYRKDCASILNYKKNQFTYDFFHGAIFLMGDVAKVMIVWELEEKKEVKLQKGSSSKSTKQLWTLRFERDRVLQPADACNSPPPKKIKTPPPIPLPARPPSLWVNPPTTYEIIHTRKNFNQYLYIWLKHNMKGEHVSDTENKLYRALVDIYG